MLIDGVEIFAFELFADFGEAGARALARELIGAFNRRNSVHSILAPADGRRPLIAVNVIKTSRGRLFPIIDGGILGSSDRGDEIGQKPSEAFGNGGVGQVTLAVKRLACPGHH
jgi:hypothetical protein